MSLALASQFGNATTAYDAQNCFFPYGDGWVYRPYTYPSYTYTVTQRCAWCQGEHAGKCPDLKSVTYDAQGRVTHVEFFSNKH